MEGPPEMKRPYVRPYIKGRRPKPPFGGAHMFVAAEAASFLPRVVSSTSAQPVKSDAAFHSLCPWRRNTTVAKGSSADMVT